jgi:hypothetical protein
MAFVTAIFGALQRVNVGNTGLLRKNNIRVFLRKIVEKDVDTV